MENESDNGSIQSSDSQKTRRARAQSVVGDTGPEQNEIVAIPPSVTLQTDTAGGNSRVENTAMNPAEQQTQPEQTPCRHQNGTDTIQPATKSPKQKIEDFIAEKITAYEEKAKPGSIGLLASTRSRYAGKAAALKRVQNGGKADDSKREADYKKVLAEHTSFFGSLFNMSKTSGEKEFELLLNDSGKAQPTNQ